MFKRVERKRKRKEEEEALGLDEETKEVLGLNDTDSDESASSGDDSSDNEDAEGLDAAAEAQDEDNEEASEEEDSEDEDQEATIPIRTALTNPIYVVALEPTTTHSCAVCPGRILKGSQMLEAHHRRFKQFKAKASHHENLDDDSSIIIALIQETKTVPDVIPSAETEGDAVPTSKRAQKSKTFFKVRREKRKQKAVEQAKAKNPDSAPPLKKKKKKARKAVTESVASAEE